MQQRRNSCWKTPADCQSGSARYRPARRAQRQQDTARQAGATAAPRTGRATDNCGESGACLMMRCSSACAQSPPWRRRSPASSRRAAVAVLVLERPHVADRLDQPPRIGGENDDALAEIGGFGDRMGDEQDRSMPVRRHRLSKLVVEAVAGDLVERPERFVHQKQASARPSKARAIATRWRWPPES